MRTKKCQDYYHLSDTALPVCNYVLLSNEGVGWNFYSAKKAEDINGDIQVMADTNIQNKVYKRIKINHKLGEYTDEAIYYIDCNIKNNIFHLNRSLEEMFPNCKITRMETKDDVHNAVKWVLDISNMKESLTNEENRIFKKWANNSRETKLPLIKWMESMRFCNVSSERVKKDSSGYKKVD